MLFIQDTGSMLQLFAVPLYLIRNLPLPANMQRAYLFYIMSFALIIVPNVNANLYKISTRPGVYLQ